jgi:methionyl-tRNA formyltransferase
MTAPRVVAFGDTVGLPRLLRHVPPGAIHGLVRAAIREEQAEALEQLAADHGLPLLVQPRVDAPEYAGFVAALRAFAPEVVLVDSYSMLLREDVLSLTPERAFNLHGALLPAYRGPNPIQWAIINGEREAGVTLHHMTDAFDAGDMVAQRRVPIAFTDTWRDVADRVDVATERLLSEELDAVLAGRAERRPQDEARSSRYPRRGPEDGRIDWGLSVRRIHDLVRALVAPLPGAFYDEAGGEVVLDRYLTVAEVAALKFGGPGGASLHEADAALAPDGVPGDDAVGLGPVTLRAIDWDRGVARLVGPAADAAVERLVARFAFAELELDEVVIEADGRALRRERPVSRPARR